VVYPQAATAAGAFVLALSDNGAVPDRGFPIVSISSDLQLLTTRSSSSGPNGLLIHVHANASDKSLEIAESLVVNTALVGSYRKPECRVGGRPVLKFGNNVEVADFIFDPFDRPEAFPESTSRSGLFGYCIFIDGHTLGPFNDEAIQEYCNRPTAYQQQFYKAPPLATRDDVLRPNFGGIA